MALVACSCSKKEAPIPSNSLQLTVQGKQIIFLASTATVTLSKKNTKWDLAAKTTDATLTSILVGASSSGASVEEPGSYSANSSNATANAGSTYGYYVLADFNNACGTTIYQYDYITYNTGAVPAGLPSTLPNFTLTIKSVDRNSHTVSGTFAGSYWKSCDKVEITDGQFNLPYTVKP